MARPRRAGVPGTDLIIRGGTVLDGTGGQPMDADVSISAGRIVSIGSSDHQPRRPDTEIVDATGLLVTPGFIDIHTHSDVSLLLDGRGEGKVRQGVTTDVVGNCGFSAFPLVDGHREEQLDLLAGVGDPVIDADWTDLDGYAAALERSGLAINVVPLVGHGQLRIAVMGGDDRPATAAEQQRMYGLLGRMLDQGAWGLSTGLTYAPSRSADTTELAGLCRLLAARGRIYATHARGTGLTAVREAVELAGTGVGVQYSHLSINEPDRWGTASQVLAIMDKARESGLDLTHDVYPYDASASALTQYLPAWLTAGGVGALRSRLADPATEERAEREVAGGWGEGGRIPWFWDRVTVSRGDGLCAVRDGESIDEAARRSGSTPVRLVLDLCRQGGNRPQVILHYRTEDDMRTFLRHPKTMIGSDGSALPYDVADRMPHPRAYGTHARVLGRYVRDEAVITMPEAVKKMTSTVAARLGLVDRGVLRPGAVADLVLLDPQKVADRATFADPSSPPEGIHRVYCNGVAVVEDGEQTDRRPGQVLRASG